VSIIIGTISAFRLVDSALIVFVVPVLFLSGLIFAEISLMCVALVPGVDSLNYFYTLLMSPMFLFSGIFFPLDSLPSFVSKIAWFTPLFHLTNVCRALAEGSPGKALEGVIWIIVVVIILAPFPFKLMRRRIIR